MVGEAGSLTGAGIVQERSFICGSFLYEFLTQCLFMLIDLQRTE